ncbi:MAG: phytase [Bacteroidota bacterium]
MKVIKYPILLLGLFACQSNNKATNTSESEAAPIIQTEMSNQPKSEKIKPLIVSDTTAHDSDDPAIWVNPEDPSQSLILGTDKDEEGALYVFDLDGKIIPEKTIQGLKRPNNVDLEYGLDLGGKKVDIAVVTERLTHNIRIFSVPDMQAIDGGGIGVFEGETEADYRDLMGIALYKNPEDEKIYAIVGRKNGPKEGYLWQYLLEDDGNEQVKATLVRKFGAFSGKQEIEAIAVDDELGYVYYSDETVGIRKYYADPEKGNDELALFGQYGFAEDHEGISIYTLGGGKGYILVSDQQADCFRVFPREGTEENTHEHPLLKVIPVSTSESDGSEVSPVAFNKHFAKGLFVAMSDDKTFQFYRWEDLAGEDLVVKVPQ